MSATGIESVLTKAMGDSAFAEQLFANPEKALAGFDLTAEEIANLKSMSRTDFDQIKNASLEERKSFGWANHNETIL